MVSPSAVEYSLGQELHLNLAVASTGLRLFSFVQCSVAVKDDDASLSPEHCICAGWYSTDGGGCDNTGCPYNGETADMDDDDDEDGSDSGGEIWVSIADGDQLGPLLPYHDIMGGLHDVTVEEVDEGSACSGLKAEPVPLLLPGGERDKSRTVAAIIDGYTVAVAAVTATAAAAGKALSAACNPPW